MIPAYYVAECGNCDSCCPGTTHHYPEPGSAVFVRAGSLLSIEGEDLDYRTTKDVLTEVIEVIEEAHLVVVTIDGKEMRADIHSDLVNDTAVVEPFVGIVDSVDHYGWTIYEMDNGLFRLYDPEDRYVDSHTSQRAARRDADDRMDD